MKIKALIFDFDGLVLDTETPEYQALNQVYAEYGQHLPIETYGLAVGSEYGQRFEPLTHLEQLLGKPLDSVGFWEKVNFQRMTLIEQNLPLPGIETGLREGQALGLKLAIASSSPHSWVDGHLKRLGLFHYFDVIKCKEDIARIKPAPDLFLAALQALQLQPEEAIIFEDSVNGVLAARRAGIRVVAIPNPITRHMHFEGEALLLGSLAELPLRELLARV
jgi:HAD superfamily hydrolase (TIGR01509 family)